MAQPNSPDALPNCTVKILSHQIKYVLFTQSHYSDHTDDTYQVVNFQDGQHYCLGKNVPQDGACSFCVKVAKQPIIT